MYEMDVTGFISRPVAKRALRQTSHDVVLLQVLGRHDGTGSHDRGTRCEPRDFISSLACTV